MKNTPYISVLIIVAFSLTSCGNYTPMTTEQRIKIQKDREDRLQKKIEDEKIYEQKIKDVYERDRRGDILFCTLKEGLIDLKKWQAYEPSYFEIARGENKSITIYVPHKKRKTKLWVSLSDDANLLRVCKSKHHLKRQYRYNSTDNNCGEVRGMLELRHTNTVNSNVGINSRLKNATLRCSLKHMTRHNYY